MRQGSSGSRIFCKGLEASAQDLAPQQFTLHHLLLIQPIFFLLSVMLPIIGVLLFCTRPRQTNRCATMQRHRPMRAHPLVAVILAFVAFTLVRCGGENEATRTEPPEGWQATETRWWQEDVDTSRVFRSLDSLEAMGVVEGEQVLAATPDELSGDQLVRAVKESLLELYRHEPEVIDSLFERHVTPDLEGTSVSGDMEAELKKLQKESYDTINRYFQEPSQATQLGDDVPVAYPDSLRNQVGGQVQMQVYVNSDGEPEAVKIVEGVHPTLDALAMNAARRMRWEPATVIVDGEERQEIPSWVYFSLNFRQP